MNIEQISQQISRSWRNIAPLLVPVFSICKRRKIILLY
jgi:hypothetical protein